MKTNEQLLQELGLSTNESILYLYLTENDCLSVSELSKKTGLHRKCIYESLDKLKYKQLILEIDDECKVFKTTQLSNLKKLVLNKQNALALITERLDVVKKQQLQHVESNMYQGLMQIKGLFDEFLESSTPLLALGVPSSAAKKLQSFLVLFHKERIKRKIPMKHIYNSDSLKRVKYLKTLPLTAVRVFDKSLDASVATNICGDSVVFFYFDFTPVVAIRIKDETLAKAHKKYFGMLWAQAKTV